MSGETHRLVVDLADRPYLIAIGPQAIDDLADVVPWPSGASRAAIVTEPAVAEHHGARVRNAVAEAGLEPREFLVPPGEPSKSFGVLEDLLGQFADWPLGRSDVVVALGGGVVGDLAGFAAAVWNRGVAVVQLPTTLLAQVDSAVGGKTGINLPQGKNLVGAFHQPLGVVADISTLATLPARERRAGLGEVTKYGFIEDPGLLDLLEQQPDAAVAGDPVVLTQVVRRGLAVKARIVAADERESGERALLNYGHTFAHAIEALAGYGTYRHGEAVAIGMVAAAELSVATGAAQPGLAERTRHVLAGLGLPTGGVDAGVDAMWDVMRRDKKAAASGVRFVLCRRPGETFVAPEPDRALVDRALRAIGCS